MGHPSYKTERIKVDIESEPKTNTENGNEEIHEEYSLHPFKHFLA